MSKVLAVSAANVPQFSGILPDPNGMTGPFVRFAIQADFQFVDREHAERDPGFKQIIPYVVVGRAEDASDPIKYLTYTRSKEGSEGRLHSKLSIGIGGHIEVQDHNGNPDEANVMSILPCLIREMKEEIGVDIGEGNWPALGGLIYDPSTEVGQCHLGVLFLWRPPADCHILTENAIENAQWLTIDQLAERFDELEAWSQFFVKLAPGFDACKVKCQKPEACECSN